MKPWIKLEYSLLQDSRIEHLVEELGNKGLGVYIIVRLLTECRNGGGMTMSELLLHGSKYTSRRIISRVVNDFDLFDEDESGLVRMRAGVRADVQRAGLRTDVQRTGLRADEHIDLIENIEIDIEKEMEEEKEEVPTTTTNSSCSMDSIQRVREWLLDEGNLIWREPMMMHSGYGQLLQQHWKEAVEFFIQHMLSQDKLDRMTNEHEAKRYFANFSKVGLGSGKALMEHLSSLHSYENHNEYENQSLITNHSSSIESIIPADAPPKPSPTAQWDFATDSWNEFY